MSIVFRYIIQRTDTGDFLSKRNKWKNRIHATEYNSKIKAEKRCLKLNLQCRLEIYRIHYQTSLEEPFIIFENKQFDLFYNWQYSSWQKAAMQPICPKFNYLNMTNSVF